MANPLSVLIGGSTPAHAQREAQIAEAAAQQGKPPAPQPAAAPTPPATMPTPNRQPSFIAGAATNPPQQQQTAVKTLLGS